VGFGPFVGLAMSEFFWCGYSGVPTSSLGASFRVDHPSLHEWLTLGVQAILDFGR
jgi:hypothetical protein